MVGRERSFGFVVYGLGFVVGGLWFFKFEVSEYMFSLK